MQKEIEIRSVSTVDVKIAQKALEKIGFKMFDEGDCIEVYWVRMTVPEEFSHGKSTIRTNPDMNIRGNESKECGQEIEW